MKAKDQRDNDRKFFLDICSKIAQKKPEDLIRKSLGEINFEMGEELFQQMISFCSKALKYDWQLAPLSSLLDRVSAPIAGVREGFAQLDRGEGLPLDEVEKQLPSWISN